LIMASDPSPIPGLPADSDWTAITEDSPAEIEVFVALKSRERIPDKVVRVWIKYRYSTPRSFGSGHIRELVVHNEYSCGERKYKILRSEAYFTDGTHEPDLSERQGYVLPGDAAYKYLCE
jgi:hypothetical protein